MNHYTKLTTQQCKQISGGVAGDGVKGGVPYDDTNNTTLQLSTHTLTLERLKQ